MQSVCLSFDFTPSCLHLQDGTLAVSKSGADFPLGPDDWKLFNSKVPEVVQQYAADGYKIVIFRQAPPATAKLQTLVLQAHFSLKPNAPSHLACSHVADPLCRKGSF